MSAVDFNTRFLSGRASSRPEEAGVYVHVFDEDEQAIDEKAPWLPNPSRWLPTALDAVDRISTSVVYGAMTADPSGEIPVLSYGLSGTLLAPEFNRVLCSYHYDAGTLNRRCDSKDTHCIPGCTPHAGMSRRLPTWNDPNGTRMWCTRCAPPDRPYEHCSRKREVRQRVCSNPRPSLMPVWSRHANATL